MRRFPLLCLAALCFGCSLDKVIEVKLPPYERQLVAECYIEYDKPVQVLLTESQSYFDSLKLNIINGAHVVIQGKNTSDSLTNQPTLDFENRKFYNYSGYLEDGIDTTSSYSIRIQDKLGRVLTGTTKFIAKPVVDSILHTYDPLADSSVNIQLWLHDFAGQKNYYRIVMNVDSLSGYASYDLRLTDNLGDGKSLPIGTGYRFKKGSTIYIRVFHIEKQYYYYMESLDDANRSNGNPFAQPATVKSAMLGGYGIFTTLNYRQYKIKL